jgi:hypothetical protein
MHQINQSDLEILLEMAVAFAAGTTSAAIGGRATIARISEIAKNLVGQLDERTKQNIRSRLNPIVSSTVITTQEDLAIWREVYDHLI